MARFRRYLKNVVAADPDEILKASDIQMANDKLLKFYSYGNVISYATLVVTTILTQALVKNNAGLLFPSG